MDNTTNCYVCQEQFNTAEEVLVHMQRGRGRVKCIQLFIGGFSVHWNLGQQHVCSVCSQVFSNPTRLRAHQYDQHPNNTVLKTERRPPVSERPARPRQRAVKRPRERSPPARLEVGDGKLQVKTFPADSQELDIHLILNLVRPKIREALSNYLNATQIRAKFFFVLQVEFVKWNFESGEEMDRQNIFLRSNTANLFNMGDFTLAYDQGVREIWRRFDVFLANGSGYILDRIM